MTYDYKTRVKRLETAIDANQIFLTEISKKYMPDQSYFNNYNQNELDDQAYNEYSTLNYAVFMYISRDWTLERKKER